MSRLYSISSNKLNYEKVMFGNGLLEFELNLYMMEEPVTKSSVFEIGFSYCSNWVCAGQVDTHIRNL